MKPENIKSITFGVFSPEQIRKMSVAKLTVPDTYNEDGYPIDNGLLDQRLGVIEPGLVCKTCGGRARECPGHFGHIELVRPVIHAEFAKIIYMLLRSTCQKCHRILLNDEQIQEFKVVVNKELNKESDEETVNFENAIKGLKNIRKCPHCGAEQEKLTFSMPTYFYLGEKRLKPDEIRDMLAKIPNEDLALLGIDYKVARPEWLILDALLVPPVNVRPSITLESGERSEDDLTHKLVDIIRINQRLEQNINAGAPQIIIDDLWELLQYHVTTYFNNETSGIPPARHRSGRALKTLAQRLKGKEGRFRYNLSGKRVNFSARTVISADGFIDIDEVGVPKIIAERLTIPFYVTEWNIEEAKELLKRTQPPMALNVIMPDGKRKRVLDTNRDDLLKGLAPGQIIERQLQDGDIVLFNRQPSLHRISIMAHRVKIMPGKTFRLNDCAAAPYNADYDGDEMNLHVPQSLEAQAEAKHMLEVKDQVFSPRDGRAIITGEQDAIVGLYLLTKDGSFLTKSEAVHLLSLAGIRELPKEAKKGLYAGKDVFSMLLPKGLNYEEKKGNTTFKISGGVLKEGAMTKSTFGEGSKLFVAIAKQFGFDALKSFISNTARIGYAYATMSGVTIGIKEYMLDEQVDAEKAKILDRMYANVDKLISEYKEGKLEPLLGKTARESLEQLIMAELDLARSATDEVISKYVPESNFAMTLARSGARGSPLNVAWISMFLGQQAPISGGRIYRGYSTRRVLPSMLPKSLGPDDHGFIPGNFLHGLTPQELFMHANGSRASIIHKGLLTARSGYLYRRLSNAMQDYFVHEDLSVRDANNNLIETLYGGDGIDPTKVQFVEEAKKQKELLVNPGEPVGMVAAQSVGEPGTQMILRTFHFAGLAATITTVGLPRLIELLDARKTPTTPQMIVYLLPEYAKTFEKAIKISEQINEIKMQDVAKRAVENFSLGRILILLNKQALKAADMTAGEVANIIAKKFGVETQLTKEGNIEISAKTKNLSEIRNISTRIMHSMLKGIEGAGKALVLQDNSGSFYILTTGSNIEAVMKIEGVDAKRIYTNDVFEIYKVFGIEAARNAIANELAKTLQEQGITVNQRHLKLIADAMTATGEIKSVGRHGIVGAKESVFARAAFEETVKHLVNAAAFGEKDNMRNVAENIIVGKQIPVGTGSVKLAIKSVASEKGKSK
ncbi:MAG: DNA-directed RNA polymerase subunit A' [Candidatus Micrarchaeia archaeon]